MVIDVAFSENKPHLIFEREFFRLIAQAQWLSKWNGGVTRAWWSYFRV